jgi:hypothetical protein
MIKFEEPNKHDVAYAAPNSRPGAFGSNMGVKDSKRRKMNEDAMPIP